MFVTIHASTERAIVEPGSQACQAGDDPPSLFSTGEGPGLWEVTGKR